MAETREIGERIAAAKREIRSRSTDGVEWCRFTTELVARTRATAAAGWQIVGHGIVYNVLSENLGGFREQVAVGAADDVLASNPDVRGLFNHDPSLLLGRTRAGTMTLEDNPPTGVRYIIDPPDVSYANDLRVLMERGDVTQSSFAFRIARQGDVWEEDPESGLLIRTIIKFSGLYDVSPVTYPAYLTTDSGVASSPSSVQANAGAPTLAHYRNRLAKRERILSLEKREKIVKKDNRSPALATLAARLSRRNMELKRHTGAE